MKLGQGNDGVLIMKTITLERTLCYCTRDSTRRERAGLSVTTLVHTHVVIDHGTA